MQDPSRAGPPLTILTSNRFSYTPEYTSRTLVSHLTILTSTHFSSTSEYTSRTLVSHPSVLHYTSITIFRVFHPQRALIYTSATSQLARDGQWDIDRLKIQARQEKEG
jgi:hypothetical protein